MIINSLLDNDMYKFTMGQSISVSPWKNACVTYRLFNRSKHVRLADCISIAELTANLKHLFELEITKEEGDYLKSIKTASFANPKQRRLFSDLFVNGIIGKPLGRSIGFGVEQKDGQLDLWFQGSWQLSVFYETPVMATITELFGKHSMEQTLTLDGREAVKAIGVENTIRNLKTTIKNRSLRFSDFGTRRRFSFAHHEQVVERFLALSQYQFSGTSNLFFAMKYGLKPIGTLAHEMFMVAAAILEAEGKSPIEAYRLVMQQWKATYGDTLSILLTDTFTTDWLFNSDLAESVVKDWEGVRHDSGDAIAFGEKYIALCKRFGVDPMTKVIVFSDSLDFQKMVYILEHFRGQVWCTFGIGTNLTNNTGFRPLNIVIKATEVEDTPTVKLSDDPGKQLGESAIRYRELFKVA